MHCSQPLSAAAQVWTLGNARQSTERGGASPSPRTRRIHSAWCLPSQCRPSSHLELRPADVVDGAVCPASGAGWALPAGDSGRLPLEKLA